MDETRAGSGETSHCRSMARNLAHTLQDHICSECTAPSSHPWLLWFIKSPLTWNSWILNYCSSCQLSKSTESLQARFTLSPSFVVVQSLSYVWFFETAWTVTYQAPLSLGFPRQEYRSGLPFSSPGESSRPKDGTSISCIGRWILYHWATREAQHLQV